jgi:hypothetical protein
VGRTEVPQLSRRGEGIPTNRFPRLIRQVSFACESHHLEVCQLTPMNPFKKWLQDHLGLMRIVLLLFVGLNLFSAHRMFSVSLLLALAHIVVAAVLLLAVIVIHQSRPR